MDKSFSRNLVIDSAFPKAKTLALEEYGLKQDTERLTKSVNSNKREKKKKEKRAKSICVVDTNVFLFDPQAIFSLGDHDVVIPIMVIEEVDRFKKDQTENGRNARQFSRYLDEFRKKTQLNQGVEIRPGGGKLMVELGVPKGSSMPVELEQSMVDNQILAIAWAKQKANPDRPVVLISKDTNLRIKADAVGIRSEDYEPEGFQADELYGGVTILETNADTINTFMTEGKLPGPIKPDVYPNEYVVLKDSDNSHHYAFGRWSGQEKALMPLIRPGEGIWGIYPKNAEQTFALDLLLNDEIKLVSLVGKAGTGKTLLALAAGLARTIDEGAFNRLLVSRPVFPMGRDIGYLPGDIEEKLNPWMQPIFDNLDYLFGAVSRKYRRGAMANRGAEELINQGMLSVEALTYIRGRSIPQQFMIVDEAQNLSPHEIKTIITRAGDNTKIILTGDPYQIDNPYIDAASNGLAHVVERFKDHGIAGHITLNKGERSALAELASNIL
jgi:PhoH-like ATPase